MPVAIGVVLLAMTIMPVALVTACLVVVTLWKLSDRLSRMTGGPQPSGKAELRHQVLHGRLCARGLALYQVIQGVGRRSASSPGVWCRFRRTGRLKLSPGKATLPGPKQVFRDPGGDSGNVVGLRDEPPPGDRRPLLAPVMGDGRRVGPADAR
ncbi:MAG TPA: hypothetical protein VHN18_06565 [Micromonosporaceae bacterium]|nr:hypothetical protein [Micromonosporaceae bacterium]